MSLRWLIVALCLLIDLPGAFAADGTLTPSRRSRRILYNLDGDSCMTLKAGRAGAGPITTNDLRRLVTELTAPGSGVDTLLVCVNAQVMYYPTGVGTQRGTLASETERAAWPASERQRFENLATFFRAGVDPYAYLIGEARQRGLEALITFRMNDAHGNDFLRTRFWNQHEAWRLPGGALNFTHTEVREHVFRLIEEAVRRYDADGLELDFQRFPTFFAADSPDSPAERVGKINALVERVRGLLDEEGRRRGRHLVLTARVPSDYGQGAPTYAQSVGRGCDPAAWARQGWIDFLTVSEWLFTAPSLDLPAWKTHVPGLPIYAGIQPESQPSSHPARCEFCLGPQGFRRIARERWANGADGIYLFNFFTSREWTEPLEPPFEVLSEIGDPVALRGRAFAPWETNAPIAATQAERYREHPRPRAAALSAVHYVGPNRERREWRAVESKDDVADDQSARWSLDNGKTWSEWVPQQPSSLVDYAGTKVWEGGWADTYHPESQRLVQAWLRQIQIGPIFHCFTYVRTSTDLGRTWSRPTPLRYEEGAEFSTAQPNHAQFLNRNEGYPGNNFARLGDGTLVLALAHANAPGDPLNDQRPWRMGSVLFRGRWNPTDQSYQWTPGARLEISPDRSARGLMEPEVAVLQDGRLLVVWRGSDTGWDGSQAKEPGRKWFSLSTNGGQTLSPPEPWRYRDGTPFYSASSIHRLHRHSVTGKLYWFGNLSVAPPRGNHPRYPLVIAEVDETSAMLRKETVSVIADRNAHHSPTVQFSNFSLLEDRETHAYELHLTTYGQEKNPADWATADAYRYRVVLRPERPSPPPR